MAIANMPATPLISMMEELECKICFELAVSPINSCGTGHIICGFCVRKLRACGMCRSPLMGPNPWAERLVRKHDLHVPCRNVDSGCQLMIRSWKLAAHLDICEYRPIECFMRCVKDCNRKLCNPNEFHKHLTVDHEIPCLVLDKDNMCELTDPWYQLYEAVPVNYESLSSIAFKAHGRDFVLVQFTRGAYFNFWMAIIGTESEAKDFTFRVEKFHPDESETDNKKKRKCISWSLPVLPLHKSMDFDSVAKTGDFGSIHLGSLNSLAKEKTDDEHKYLWTYNVSIIKPDGGL